MTKIRLSRRHLSGLPLAALVCLSLSACSRGPEADQESDVATLGSAGTVRVVATATPSRVKPGGEMALRMTITTTRSTFIDVQIAIQSPNGSLAMTHKYSMQPLLRAGTLTLEDRIGLDATEPVGVYSVFATITQSSTGKVLVNKQALAQFTVANESVVSHTDNQNGAWHMPGKEDPMKTCTACHGQTLHGGKARACYDCHDAKDHSAAHHHLSGKAGKCLTCHGPNNSGGLGPACAQCHR